MRDEKIRKDKLENPKLGNLVGDLVQIRKRLRVSDFMHPSLRKLIGHNEPLSNELMKALLEKLVRQYVGYNFDADILLMSFGLLEGFENIRKIGKRREKFLEKYMEERCHERYLRYMKREEDPETYEKDGGTEKGERSPWKKTKDSLEKDERALAEDLAISIFEEDNIDIIGEFKDFIGRMRAPAEVPNDQEAQDELESDIGQDADPEDKDLERPNTLKSAIIKDMETPNLKNQDHSTTTDNTIVPSERDLTIQGDRSKKSEVPAKTKGGKTNKTIIPGFFQKVNQKKLSIAIISIVVIFLVLIGINNYSLQTLPDLSSFYEENLEVESDTALAIYGEENIVGNNNEMNITNYFQYPQLSGVDFFDKNHNIASECFKRAEYPEAKVAIEKAKQSIIQLEDKLIVLSEVEIIQFRRRLIEINILYGNILFALGEPAPAKEQWMEAIAVAEDEALKALIEDNLLYTIHHAISCAYFDLGKFEQAIYEEEQALQLLPENISNHQRDSTISIAYILIGNCYQMLYHQSNQEDESDIYYSKATTCYAQAITPYMAEPPQSTHMILLSAYVISPKKEMSLYYTGPLRLSCILNICMKISLMKRDLFSF